MNNGCWLRVNRGGAWDEERSIAGWSLGGDKDEGSGEGKGGVWFFFLLQQQLHHGVHMGI